ncbi:hypothetical protein ACE1TF_20305 [Geomicrobium sp. JSM 1781026]|uniref:hypothetical protein n=1 Tax=Geomicrobium sp. JSM 1781026 TaxID=3344580 RepID=UPI0035C08CE5
MARKIMFGFYTGIEVNLLLGLFYVIYALISPSFPLLQLVLFVFTCSFILVWAVETPKKKQRLFIIGALLLLFVVGWGLYQIILIPVLLIQLLVMYRIISHQPFSVSERLVGRFLVLIGMNVMVAAFLQSFGATLPVTELFFYLASMTLAAITYLTLSFMSANNGKSNQTLIVWQGGLIGSLLLILTVIYFNLSVIERMVAMIIEGILTLLTFIVTPIFQLFGMLFALIAPEDVEPPLEAEIEMGAGSLEEQETYVPTELFDITWIFATLTFLVCIVLAVIFIRKVIRGNEDYAQNNHLVQNASSGLQKTLTNRFKNLYSAPDKQQLIRKEVEKLEQYAKKKEVPRDPRQTIHQWLLIVTKNLTDFDLTAYVDVYEGARYGHRTIDDQDTNWFKKETKRIKEHLKN